MPVYEYEWAHCRVIYEVREGMSDPPLAACPRCTEPVNRIISAPNLNRYNFSSPTEAKYAKVTPREEIAKEDRKSTRLNSSHGYISYAVFCLKKKNEKLGDQEH